MVGLSVLGVQLTLEGLSSLNHSMILQSQSPQRNAEVLTDISTTLVSVSVSLCFPHSNLHPVPPSSDNSWWCLSSPRAQDKLPWHVFVLGEGVPGAAGTGAGTMHHTQLKASPKDITLVLELLPARLITPQ